MGYTKTKNRFLILLLTLFGLTFGSAMAQDNRIYIPDMMVPAGQTKTMQVMMDNASDIVAIQFTLTLPDDIDLDPSTVLATSRCANHRVAVRYVDEGQYMFVILSTANEPILGNTGKLLDIDLTASSSLAANSVLTMTMSKVILSIRNGDNAVTSFEAGSIHIGEAPDIVVSDITADATSYDPLGTMNLSWKVTNQGLSALQVGWQEEITLVSAVTGHRLELVTRYRDLATGELAAGTTEQRTTQIELPQELEMDGEAYIEIRLVPEYGSGENENEQTNNTTRSTSAITLMPKLYIESMSYIWEEPIYESYSFLLYRSGDISEAETFRLSVDDSRIQMAEEVTIPAGYSYVSCPFTVENDDNYTGDKEVTFTAQNDKYAAVSESTTIYDDESPSLTLTSSKATLAEGDHFTITITADYAPTETIQLYLNYDEYCAANPYIGYVSRIDYDPAIYLNAGQTSVQVPVEVLVDDIPSLNNEVEFTVSATGYEDGTMTLVLTDDDMPHIDFTLTPSVVSESDGYTCISGVLRRWGVTDNAISVAFTDNSSDQIFYTMPQIGMESGVTEVPFQMGVYDNNLVDGSREVQITATVVATDCWNATGTNVGVATQTLTIADDDGPKLTLSATSTTLREGYSVTLTLTRNTSTEEALTVQLTGNPSERLTFRETVTIPKGQQSVQVPVSCSTNTVVGDDHTTTIVATAEGHSPASIVLTIADHTLPDAQITLFDATESTQKEVGQTVGVRVIVTNSGLTTLPEHTPVVIRTNNNTNVAALYTSRALAPSENETLLTTITLPNQAGEHTYRALVNPERTVSELNVQNNYSDELVLTALAPFAATLTTDKSLYTEGETIQINGQISGSLTANQTVEVYFIVNGYRMTQRVTTDSEGRFTTSYKPTAGLFGHFSIGACFPSEKKTAEMAGVDVIGLLLADYTVCMMRENETASGSIALLNPSGRELHNVRIVSSELPESMTASFGTIATMTASSSSSDIKRLSFQLMMPTATGGTDYRHFPVTVTCDEGVELTTDIYYYVKSLQGKIETTTSLLTVNVLRGGYVDYTLPIFNSGEGETGEISLSLPDGITAVSAATIGSLASGANEQITLRFQAAADAQVNVPIEGTIGINCTNGTGLSLPFRMTPVSDSQGTIVFDIYDENTYAGGPHVSGVQIALYDYGTKAEIERKTTGTDGRCSFTLNEGWYHFIASESNHQAKEGDIYIEPDKETLQAINLSLSGIKVEWKVEETEVEDEYRVVNTFKFETNVPIPIVTTQLPERVDGDALAVGESLDFVVTLTNEGSIAAEDVYFDIPETENGLCFTKLALTKAIRLEAHQTVNIPIRMTRCSDEQTSTYCTLTTTTEYGWWCGTDKVMNSYYLYLTYLRCTTEQPPYTYTPPTGGQSSATTITNTPGCYICGVPTGGYWGGGFLGGGTGYGGTVVVGQPVVYTGCNPGVTEFTTSYSSADRSYPLSGEAMPIKLLYDDFANSVVAAGNNHTLTWSDAAKELAYVMLYTIDAVAVSSQSQLDEYLLLWEMWKTPSDHNYESAYLTRFREVTGIAYRIVSAYRDLNYLYTGENKWLTIEQRIALVNHLQVIATSTTEVTATTIYSEVEWVNTFLLRFKRTVDAMVAGTPSAQAADPNAIAEALLAAKQAEAEAETLGYTSSRTMWETENATLVSHLEEIRQASVCAQITLQFEQSVKLTRQAFRGTLSVFNGHETTPMTNVALHLTVRNVQTGTLTTEHEFQINAESLNGFTGNVSLTDPWSLAPQATGEATILFIPTKYAAPTDTVEYAFGGTLSYTDPFTGAEITRTLMPVQLKVAPSPDLTLTYFMQRDILGDDALTDEIEPMEEAEFALLIHNKGYGAAKNFTITTQQPKIVDNEKGLDITFRLVSSQLNGASKSLALDKAVTNNFGTIAAQSTAYAQWWIESSLLGHFTDYDVSLEHLTSYGNSDLSLIESASVHELIRSIETPKGIPTRMGWLVNDVYDDNDTPDSLYFTDGTRTGVIEPTTANLTGTSHPAVYHLHVAASKAAWVYGNIEDPTNGEKKLVSVKRQSDDAPISLRSFWQTDRTLRDDNSPLYENRLHFIDTLSLPTETYILTFEEEEPETTHLVISTTEQTTLETATPVASFTIEADGEKAGQLFGAENLQLENDEKAFYRFLFHAQARRWYAFSVPFPCNAETLTNENGQTLRLDAAYNILQYNGATRAANGKDKSAWEFIADLPDHTLYPGRLYMILFAQPTETAVFTKKAQADIVYSDPVALNVYAGEAADCNWNGIANPRLYSTLLNTGVAYGQVYDAVQERYDVVEFASKVFPIGLPVFVQVAAQGTLEANLPSPVAARRAAQEDDAVRCEVTLTTDGQTNDRIIIAASEDAADQYTVGQDVAKISTAGKVAQMWVDRYNARLCVNTTGLQDNTAEYPLGISIPTNGKYTFNAALKGDIQAVLLTRDGQVIADLSEGEYTMDLDKGVHSNYALRLITRGKQTPTGIENAEILSNGKKIIFRNALYILHDGVWYDAQGRQLNITINQ